MFYLNSGEVALFSFSILYNWDECLKFLKGSDFVVNGNYYETWDYIKKEKHSLERKTNINLSFPKNNENDE